MTMRMPMSGWSTATSTRMTSITSMITMFRCLRTRGIRIGMSTSRCSMRIRITRMPTTGTSTSGSVVLDAGDVVFGGAAGVGIDPLVDAELGFGFLQRLAGLEILAAGGEHRGFRIGTGGEGAVSLVLARRFPVETVGPLEHATARRLLR